MDTYVKAKAVNLLNEVYDFLLGIEGGMPYAHKVDAVIGQLCLSGMKDLEKAIEERNK